MRIRWAVATLAALALSLLTLSTGLPWPFPTAEGLPVVDAAEQTAAASPTPRPRIVSGCPTDAKPANLSFTLNDMSGTSVRLADYKGKVILLDFWATWCIPCKVEIPWFVEFQTKYGPKGLQAIGVSVDDTVAKLKPYVAQFKMNYPVLLGLGHDDIQDAYGPIWGLPLTVLISRDGKTCSKHTGLGSKAAFESEIKALLAANALL
jgi:cytochrome c biogenesis protein CcmG/thiol:disulfide interchange protein DsbE